jgi:hypothetical protein
MIQFYKIAAVVFFILAAGLRLLLFWANPPENAFDDHFEPILLIMENGAVPSKEECWECFQPPFFYLISAATGNVVRALEDVNEAQQLKLFQFLPCLYGILTVFLIYSILGRVNLSDFARTLAFGMICFLPRHIYMSAMHTNDTLSYLLVTLCVYLLLVIIDRRFITVNTGKVRDLSTSGQVPPSFGPPTDLKTSILIMALTVVTVLALYTKSTALVLLPMMAVVCVYAFARRLVVFDKRTIASCAILLSVPATVVGSAVVSDISAYGRPLPLNIELLDVSLTQPPGKDDLSFFNFKPWTTIKSPILGPGNIDSFWTLIYSRLWFDMEPMFLQYTDPDDDWWDAYDDYLNRHDRYEWPIKSSLSVFTRLTGSTLIALGIVPLLLTITGIGRALFGKWAIWSETDPQEVIKVQLFVILLIFNLAGVIFHTFRHPFYSFMKAAFLLNSLSSLALFLALGLMLLENSGAFKWVITLIFGCMFLLSTAHVLHIVQSLSFVVS